MINFRSPNLPVVKRLSDNLNNLIAQVMGLTRDVIGITHDLVEMINPAETVVNASAVNPNVAIGGNTP